VRGEDCGLGDTVGAGWGTRRQMKTQSGRI
jgi:hypothetical protein